jgi:uncharacterized hydrophobic protein (TIGR00271 family)
MIGLSAAIAALGLQQNSPAVIIGAMLIAPLMSAIIGMGLAVVQGDLKFLAQSIRATLRGAGLALFMGVLIGLFDLDNSATREMLNRTGPALLDLIIAILSGAAAAYALCRKDVSAALPGVAIAVALVPPLATVGLFLSMTDWPHAGGALLLFITNLAAITFASGIVFTLFGFHPPYFQKKDVRRLKAFQKSFLAVSLLVLLVSTHLALLSVGEVAESYIENTVQTALTNYLAGYDKEITLLRWSLDDSNRKKPEVQLHLSSYVPLERERLIKLADQISLALGDPVRLSVTQLPATSVTSSNYFSSGPE